MEARVTKVARVSARFSKSLASEFELTLAIAKLNAVQEQTLALTNTPPTRG
jgi:hypothetical protein